MDVEFHSTGGFGSPCLLLNTEAGIPWPAGKERRMDTAGIQQIPAGGWFVFRYCSRILVHELLLYYAVRDAAENLPTAPHIALNLHP